MVCETAQSYCQDFFCLKYQDFALILLHNSLDDDDNNLKKRIIDKLHLDKTQNEKYDRFLHKSFFNRGSGHQKYVVHSESWEPNPQSKRTSHLHYQLKDPVSLLILGYPYLLVKVDVDEIISIAI